MTVEPDHDDRMTPLVATALVISVSISGAAIVVTLSAIATILRSIQKTIQR